ncbi:alpha/beta fold hydrolase [Seohaeicola zhoushanensis]|uniref:AB hydrolase superfamily protein YfhM n=1 Tax=Seohaeicola zhoushanensis TaxID=1569283 RepID=A0A8J3H1N7_9RHOB|nr:alpha/beta hydrolase [Seohaeicola zhoushanensis]GHF66017.1 AB hydrolase superfamily protein YfhM [Seohaeicola zhoushanensis]
MQTETISLNGHPFFLRRWGDPALPVLLLLHGFPEYGGAWAEFAPLLADRYHVIAPDQRGYGRSWAPEGVENYRGSALTGDMAALIEGLGRGKVVVLGHDWGAAVAYGLAMFRPDLVARLVIANGVHPAPFQKALIEDPAQREASQYIRFLRRTDSQDILAEDDFDRMFRFFSSKMNLGWMTPERLAEYKAEWARDGRLGTMIHWYRASPLVVPAMGEDPGPLPALPREKLMVRMPHLLLWGADDKALLPVATEGLEDFAPDLTRITLQGCDHWLFHQKPEEAAAAVRDWLAR